MDHQIQPFFQRRSGHLRLMFRLLSLGFRNLDIFLFVFWFVFRNLEVLSNLSKLKLGKFQPRNMISKGGDVQQCRPFEQSQC